MVCGCCKAWQGRGGRRVGAAGGRQDLQCPAHLHILLPQPTLGGTCLSPVSFHLCPDTPQGLAWTPGFYVCLNDSPILTCSFTAFYFYLFISKTFYYGKFQTTQTYRKCCIFKRSQFLTFILPSPRCSCHQILVPLTPIWIPNCPLPPTSTPKTLYSGLFWSKFQTLYCYSWAFLVCVSKNCLSSFRKTYKRTIITI
jgi:hypothetical protein